MNRKQKFGYTFLGALIMLVGIGVGAIVSPPLVAQRDGVFGEIECTKLRVVDKAGKTAIGLTASEDGNVIVVFDKAGKTAIGLTASEDGNLVSVYDKTKLAIRVGTMGTANLVSVYNKAGETAIGLAASEDGNAILVFDKVGGVKWNSPLGD